MVPANEIGDVRGVAAKVVRQGNREGFVVLPAGLEEGIVKNEANGATGWLRRYASIVISGNQGAVLKAPY